MQLFEKVCATHIPTWSLWLAIF